MYKYKEYYKRERHGGTQYIYKFKNGYGASVINHKHSYGRELAVIRFITEEQWVLEYETPITDDVIGNLSKDEVNQLLDKIQELDRPKVK